MCECGELVQYGSWAGAVLYAPSRGASLSRLSAWSLQRLCASVYRTSARSFARCEPTKAFVPLCTVRAPRALRGASLHRLCTSVCCKSLTSFVRCEPAKAFYRASLQRLSTVYERQELCAVRASKGFLTCTSAKSFARCEPPKALCLCVLQEPHELRAPRALRGASLQKLCASVCCRSLTSYVRCEPTKACYVLVYKNL